MIQPVNSCTISPASQTAESLLQPAQSFKEVLHKQSVAEEENKDLGQGTESLLQPAHSFKEVLHKQSVAEEENKDLEQGAESLLQPAQSFKEVLQKQSVAEEENKDPGQGKVAAAFPSNLLPILPNLGLRNNLKSQPSEVHPRVNLEPDASPDDSEPAGSLYFIAPGIVENPEQNISAFPTAQTKPDSSASAISVRQDIPNILNLKENELQAGLLPKIVQLHSSESNPEALNQGTSADPKNIWEEGTALTLFIQS